MVRQRIIVVKFGEWLTKYLDLLEQYLERYSEEFIKKSKEEGFEEMDYIEQYFLYAREYPNILRKSFLITCYSFLEHELVDECDLQQKLKPIDVTNWEGKGIERVKNYLKLTCFDVCGNKRWNEIKHIQKIRNCIVHSDGVLNGCKEKERENIRSYIESRSDISIENNEIILGSDYCRHVVKIFTEFEYDIKSALLKMRL